MKSKIIIFLLIAVAGIAVRMIGVADIQPMNSDESSYLRQARFMTMVVKKSLGYDLPVVDESERGIWRYLRHNDWSEKPCWLHTGFVAIAMLVGGVYVLSGIMVNIIFSLGSVVLIFFLTKRIRGAFAAWVSAGLLAVSGYWLIYSRSNWAEVDGVFFVLLAVYLLVCAFDSDSWRHFILVFAGGVCGGVGVLCHYRLLYIVGPIGLMSLLVGGRRRWFANGLLIVIGYFGIILCAAGVIRIVADGMGGDIPFSGLLAAIGERFFPTQVSGHVSQTSFQPLNSLAFIFYILRNQGWCAFVLMVIGIGVLIRQGERRNVGISIVILLLIPLVVLSMQKWVVARAAVIMVPFVCIAVGVGASAIWDYFEHRTGPVKSLSVTVISLFLIGLVMENMAFDARLLCNEYGSRNIATFFDNKLVDIIYADPESKITYGWFRPDLPYRKIDLLNKDTISSNSNIYVIFDAQKYHMYSAATKYVSELEKRCAKNGELVFTTTNMTTMWKEFLMDGTQANSPQEMLESMAMADINDITSIRIYKININGSLPVQL